MKKLTRFCNVLLASAGCAVAVALSTSTSALAANQALMINGLASGTLTDIVMANILDGTFGSYQRHDIPWPAQARPYTGSNGLPLRQSVDQGADNLGAAIAQALTKIGPNEHVTVVGFASSPPFRRLS